MRALDPASLMEGNISDIIEHMIDRFPCEHDFPDMRLDKAGSGICSVLPLIHSRIVVSIDQLIREQGRDFLESCIGPAFFTPAQTAYVPIQSVADIHSAGIAFDINVQVNLHFKDLSNYFEQKIHEKALNSALHMLREMVELLAFYNPYIHQLHFRELQKIHHNMR